MRLLLHFIFICGIISLAGCNAEPLQDSNNTIPVSHVISQSEAIEIANAMIQRIGLSRSSSGAPVCEPILRESQSRSAYLSDTLAYILNYPDSSGFAIVVSDDRVNPLVAFSETGSFDSELVTTNDVVIDRLEDYVNAGIIGGGSLIGGGLGPDSLGPYLIIPPVIEIKLCQSWPYNKYLEMEYPGCVTGCVTVTAATVMTYCKDHLNYHDIDFNLKSLYNNLKAGRRVVGNEIYDAALDTMAQMMYWIGKDLGIRYDLGSATSDNGKAEHLMVRLGYTCGYDYRYFYWPWAKDALINNHILLTGGTKMKSNPDDKSVGHSWVIDGLIRPEKESYEYSYVHCLWGWNGQNDGFYTPWFCSTTAGDFTCDCFVSIIPDKLLND